MKTRLRPFWPVVGLAALVACDSTPITSPVEPADPTAWTQVETVPPTVVDALIADASSIYVASLNRVFAHRVGDSAWREAASLNHDVTIVSLALADGRLFAGTLGDGVFESRDGGGTWTSRSNGLASAAERRVLTFCVRDQSLYAGTDGAGVFVYDLAMDTGWVPFRDGIPSNLSWNVGDLAVAGTRLVAGAGGNGTVYLNDAGRAEWREVSYADDGPGALRVVFEAKTIGSTAQPVVLLGTTTGMYRSTDGGESWTHYDPEVGSISNVAFAQSETSVFAAVTNERRGTTLFASEDQGSSWRHVVALPGTFIVDLDVAGDRLYSGRFDGLWSLPLLATRDGRPA